MKRLLIALAVVAAVWIALQFYVSGPGDGIDDLIVIEIAVSFGMAAVVQLIWTTEWAARVIGVFLAVTGTAVFFGGLAWTRTIADPGARSPEAVIDLARALYLVGGPLFAFGMATYAYGRIRGRDPATWPDVERRVGPAERREAG